MATAATAALLRRAAAAARAAGSARVEAPAARRCGQQQQQQQQRQQHRGTAQVSLSLDRLRQFINAELSYFAQRPTQPVRLADIVQASTPGKVAKLVHTELPGLFAARVKHIESLEGWQQVPELQKLHEIFTDSFQELRLAEPPSTEDPQISDLAAYSQVIFSLRTRHRSVTALLGEAMRKMSREDPEAESRFQAWADTFLHSRISTEMLTSHYVAIIETDPAEASTAVGIVDTRCNPRQICEEAAAQVMYSLSKTGGLVSIDVQESDTLDDIEIPYIPRYLFYIVQELLRNSAKATLEAAHSSRASGSPSDFAPGLVTVTVCADQKQVAIRISDHGGGVPSGNGSKIWSYQFSTSEQPYEAYLDGGSPLSGWGMGLPLGRLYASYLGGSLELMNMPGIGVDVYLFLRRIPIEYQQAA